MTKPRWLALLLLMLLAGCGGELDTPGEALQIFSSTLEPAILGEPYAYDLVVSGGLAPYTFEVREGRLPPGLELQGGTLRGTPTEVGDYTFTIQVSDANLARNFEEFSLEVVTAPPPELVLNVPDTEMSEPFTVPVSVRNARGLQALRTQLSWDPALFELVPGSVRPARTNLALFQRAQEGQLSLDVAVLGPSLNGEAQLFTFDLRPLEPSELSLEARTEFRSRDGDHAFSTTEDVAEEDTSEGEGDIEGIDDTGDQTPDGTGENGVGEGEEDRGNGNDEDDGAGEDL